MKVPLDDYLWHHCPQWQDYHWKSQYGYALKYSRDGNYAESLKYFDRLHSRDRENFSLTMLMDYTKSAILSENSDLVAELLGEYEDVKNLQNVIAEDILWLLQNGKAVSCVSILKKLEALLAEEDSLDITMQFYLTYAYMLVGQFNESELNCAKMRTKYPESTHAFKLTYLLKQKERVRQAYVLTQQDQFAGMINKAEKCFDQGELEMALGIYLRILAEYSEWQEECSKACYLLGYYYLLSGDFESANEILVFLEKEYEATTYAREADVLIQRIKVFTAS